MTTLTIEKDARRYYIIGNTFALKDSIKSAGCKWDGDRRAWWTSKQDIAESIVGKACSVAPAKKAGDDSISTSAEVVIGRAKYQGKTYYLLFDGHAKSDGRRIVKLAFRDGSKVFWAKEISAVQVLATYQKPKSIDDLQAYAEKARKTEAGESGHFKRCRCCGGSIIDAPHHRAMNGYCGSCAFDEFDC
jgi:hypothetical protein